MKLDWLAGACRAAGLDVEEVPGWRTRGGEFPAVPTTVICHHTATASSVSGDLPTRRVLIAGRAGLPGPLCQVGLGRSGKVYIIAAGKANHAGRGAWAGTNASDRTIGIEAEHDGVGPWPAAQYDAYLRLVRVLLAAIGQDSHAACGHKEWALPAGRKTDPTFDMNQFRRALDSKPTSPEDNDMTAEQAKQLAEVHAMLKALIRPRRTDKADHDPRAVDLGDILTNVEKNA